MAVAAFFSHYHISPNNQGLKLSVKSDFTARVGFGSSSAVSVATIKALGLLYNSKISEKEIFDLAYKVTLDIQGVGSGFDIAAATFGGTLYFRKGGSEVEMLSDALPLVVGYTGVKADTPTLVRFVQEQYKRQKGKLNKIFSEIGDLVKKSKAAVQKQDWPNLGELMNLNQKQLRTLGVSSVKLDTLIEAAKRAGAYGAKLSGAGGGDCMVAVVPAEKRILIEQAIRNGGGEVISVGTHAPGVRVETSANETLSSATHYNTQNFLS